MSDEFYGLYNTLLQSQKQTTGLRNKMTAASTFDSDLSNSANYYPQATINGIIAPMCVATKSSKVASVTLSNNNTLNAGDLVSINDKNWLCISSYEDDFDMIRGEIWLCNFEFKFQNNTSTIITKHAIIDDGSYKKDKDKEITIISNNYNCYISLDNETKYIYNDKRIAVSKIYNDKQEQILETAKVTGIDTKTHNTNEDSHLMILKFDSDVFNPENDNIELMICDYISNGDMSSEPIVINTDYEISGRNTIKIGTTRTYTVSTNLDVQLNIDWSTSILPTGCIITENETNSCTIQIPFKEELVGQIITLRCCDAISSNLLANKIIEVITIG